MVGKIEVYVRNEEVIVGSSIMGRPIHDGYTTHYCAFREIFKTEKVMPEAETLALEIVKEFAAKKGLEVDVYDVSTLKGRMQARLKGIRKTPTIIVDGNRIEGEDDLRHLENKLAAVLA